MNRQVSKKQLNSFFFFVDSLKDLEFKYLKIDTFFNSFMGLYPNIRFSVFSNSKIDFYFLEKNDKLLSFFFYDNKFFFKNQIKNLKICFLYEEKFKNIQNRLNISFFLNFFYFFYNIYCFILLLKKITFIKLSQKN